MDFIYLISAATFFISIINFFKTSNILIMLISIELTLNSLNIILIRTISINNSPDTFIWFISIITIAAAEVGIGLSILIIISKKYNVIDSVSLNKIKELFK
ncbi:MAG: NADH-quinone oxidoreductase subunit K [Elusimicrobiales bacterium]|nr:NADH-quinone oxidoreductase subunit K [Elusimicrobiales bacterium]